MSINWDKDIKGNIRNINFLITPSESKYLLYIDYYIDIFTYIDKIMNYNEIDTNTYINQFISVPTIITSGTGFNTYNTALYPTTNHSVKLKISFSILCDTVENAKHKAEDIAELLKNMDIKQISETQSLNSTH